MPSKEKQALTTRQISLVNAAVEIGLATATAKDASFISREFVQATLPHRDPKTNTWQRRNGNYTLNLQTGFDDVGNPVGLPYGVIPRLLIFWLVTEAIRIKSPVLQLGNNLASFMRDIGLDPAHGGKKGDPKRLEIQMRRFFSARIAFFQKIDNGTTTIEATEYMQIAKRYVLWWDSKKPNQSDLWGSAVRLDQDFFKAITANPIPIHTEALKQLKNSPLALDLYALCCYEAYRVEKSGKARFIPWRSLMEQLGADYTGETAVWEFARKAKKALTKIQLLMRSLHIDYQGGGLTVLPTSRPDIPSRN